MAYILTNNLNEKYVVPWLMWRDIIHLALEFNYDPIGTEIDFFGSDVDDRGNKIFDDRCSPISHMDSLQLSSVLESCLDDIPNERCSSEPDVRVDPFGKSQEMIECSDPALDGASVPKWFAEYVDGWSCKSTLISRFSGGNKLGLLDFIKYSKKSGFSVNWQIRIKGSDGKVYTQYDLSESLDD
jgi:hypothetical protein